MTIIAYLIPLDREQFEELWVKGRDREKGKLNSLIHLNSLHKSKN